MSKPSKRTKRLQVKPPISDAKPPYKEARETYANDKDRYRRVLITLGSALYERRQKTKARAILTALPKGYTVEYLPRHKNVIIGHPSGRSFSSTTRFLEHLLWLEAMSHPTSIEPRRDCKCVICADIRHKDDGRRQETIKMEDSSYNELTTDSSSSSSDIVKAETKVKVEVKAKEKASSSSALASPAATASLPASPSSSRESTPTPDRSRKIRMRPLKKVLIEQHVNPSYYYPKTFSIPLPKIKKSDESILSKSLRSQQ
ncbi:hypothetical protein MBANPS3_007764 [Mucor bainieri]